MKKDIIEINWFDADCIPVQMLEDFESKGAILVERANGEIVVCLFSFTDVFAKEHFCHDDIDYYIANESVQQIDTEEVKELINSNEFILYTREFYEEYGDYAGQSVMFIEDVIRVAIIPDSPIINAICNWCD